MHSHPLIHPDLGNGLTNHKPMVTSALKELGAEPEHIRSYQASMAKKTHVADQPLTAINDEADLHLWFGQQQNYAGIHQYLTAMTEQLTTRELLNRYLPLLADGITGGAFHPVIRLGHALHDDDTNEIVAALSYWVWTYQPLAYPKNSKVDSRPLAVIAKTLLNGVEWSDERVGLPTITEEFEAATYIPNYQLLSFKVAADALDYPALNKLALDLLWMHDDFTLLHGVTAMHAVGRVRPYLTQPDVLLEPMWKGLIIAFLSKGLKWREPADLPKKNPMNMEQMQQLAARSRNDHTIKLTAACLDSYRKTQQALYLHVAERQIRQTELS